MTPARPRFSLFQNAITIFGAALATTGAVLFLAFFLFELAGMHANPYLGMLFFLVFPGLFVAGLVIMPIGVWLAHRRDAAGLKAWRPAWPKLDLNDGVQRRAATIFLASTLANILIVSVAAFAGIEYMDSPQFCGQLCHEVMEPQWAGYQEGPHSRVACVQCHIGPGAPWFVKSKMSGLRQVVAVTFDTHSRPIPSPVHDLRPARDTCEQCHWPEKFHGDKIRTIRTYGDDEANSESVTTLRMHIGGINRLDKSATGIHWHVSQQNRIEYIATDRKRQVIPYIRLDDGRGNVTEFFAEGVTDAASLTGERRLLDCVDCHNRPSHTFAHSAERAVDEAIAAGGFDQALPFIRREAVKVLSAPYTDKAAAFAGIERGLTAFYRDSPGVPKDTVERAVATAKHVFGRNVFPTMNVTWGTYANNASHSDPGPSSFPGCFRCHDGTHKTKQGKAISDDCSLCHTIE
ncbi:MAG TPA: NapC/NirT family cytochrome c [Vicinamibacterales bacterium]|nr:NapC/NirT family cytochrome c [Vicinamibacterales bacterium]